MQPETATYLRDMLESARAIIEYTRGQTERDYLRLRPLRDSVQWNFCVIGEAMSRLLAFDSTVGSRITDARKIVDFRNQLIHSYGVINDQITWNVVESKLPTLIQELERLLEEVA
ncbi:MAG: hypothetical protein QOE14_2733 [Humisphaera sp.]|nr:hypothetical protein [Humisphaera sp.]